MTKGRGESALAGCAVVVAGGFDLPRQEHAYLETEAGWAVREENGRLTITVSTQTPFRDRAEVADALGLARRSRSASSPPSPGGPSGARTGSASRTSWAWPPWPARGGRSRCG